MSETKVFSLGDQSRSFGGGSAMEGAMLGSMMGNCGMGGGNGMWNNPWWALIFLAAFRNNGGLFGGNEGGGCQGGTQARFDALQEQLSTIQGQNALQSAIQGGTNEVKALASTLNCDINAVQAAINAVQNAICQLGNTMGLGQRDIIAAMNNGNTTIMSKLCDCCCENRLAIANQTNTLQNAINNVAVGQERGFSALAFENERQTCTLKGAVNDGIQAVLAGQRDAVMREMQNKIDALREENSTFKASAMTSQIVGQATAPLGAALSDLSARLAKIECNQPPTFPMPYCPASGNYVPVNYGINVNPLATQCGGCC